MLSGYFRAAGKSGKSIAKAICACENQRILDNTPAQKGSTLEIF